MMELIDRDKVIKGLESLRDICNAKSDMAIGKGKVAWAGYANTADDALSLLKEQEPIEPEGENCGECGYTLHRINYDGPDKELRHEWFRFCPYCGRKAKWDD